MAAALWGAVVSGTWFVYPGYRAEPPEGAETLAYPKADLLANGDMAFWHDFGMEWKEHVAWLTPFLATAVAFVAIRYGRRVTRDEVIRTSLIRCFTVAALASVVAAGLGAAINKVAPNLFLDV
jgi:predicted membrane protein